MKKFILALLLIACSAVHAEFLQLRAPNVSITLTDHACPDEVAGILKPEFKEQFKEAWVLLHGRPVLACWIRDVKDPKLAFIMTGSGQAIGVELSAFTVDVGV